MSLPFHSALLHELFETIGSERRPETANNPSNAAAFVSPASRTLDERANRLARVLRARGIGPDDRVAIFLPRSERVYIAMLGVLKAGAAYVPLDAETPMERLRFILDDSNAKCLLTLSGMADTLQNATPVMRLDIEKTLLDGKQAQRLTRAETGATPENLCYVIYTSGTTGHPKGVQIEHRNAVHLVHAESPLYGVHPEDRIFQLASPAFDASVEEIWMAFFHGATLVAGTSALIHSGPDFSGHLEKLGVTVLSCVPTFLSTIEEDIATVRILILGGEACPQELADRWQRPGRTLFNTYGPTETTVISTAARLELGKPVTIGRPIDGTQIFLLDDEHRIVPAGEPGEICIAGLGVARGYLNRPDLNQRNSSRPMRSPARRCDSIARRISRCACPTAIWNISGAPMTKSSCAAIALSWPKSKRY